MASGFIYALINPSIPDLVKVGRTDRDPTSRAKELSGATGVATPFIVAYQRAVGDSLAAEAYVHAALERKGFRPSQGREFFAAPLHEVVAAIGECPDAPSRSGDTVGADPGERYEPRPTGDSFLDGLELAESDEDQPWYGVYEEAEAYYYGLGDHLQDYSDALPLYKQAAALGCTKAIYRLGSMARYGEGMRADAQAAISYFKDGARKGAFQCYAEMGALFLERAQVENARKCYDRFFQSLSDVLGTGKKVELDWVLASFTFAYRCLDRGESIPEYAALSRLREELTETVQGYADRGDFHDPEGLARVMDWLRALG